MRSASQHPARKMQSKSGTGMEQTFRVGTEQGSLRPVAAAHHISGGINMFAQLINTLKKSPKTIVFTEGTDPRILEASARLLSGAP